MLWDRVVGHGAVKQSLRRAVEQDRVNHAYLFTGPSAVGKFTVAKVFAASILCASGGCGQCNVCRRVLEEMHPDVTVIRPAGKNIPVERLRELRLSAFRKPMEADRRIFIVKNAERMWEEGASTLLKVLEEPPGNAIFMLITSGPAGMLPTVRSRCQEITFAPVPSDELAAYLVERKGVSDDDARLIVRLTGGVLGRALDWCDERWRLARRDNVIRVARALRRADLNHALEMAGELYREVRAPVEELSSRFQERKTGLQDGSLDDSLARRLSRGLDEELKREQLKEEARGTREVLSTLAWWYRDILLFKEGGDVTLLANLDMEREIADEAEVVSTLKLLDCIELLEDGIKAAEQNVPTQLNLESVLLGVQEALYA